MKYTPSTESIPQSSRRAVNEKLLYLIDNNCCEAYGITKQDVFQGYTGDGGLHGLSRKNYRSYHTYSEAKKELENGQFFTPPALCQFVADCLRLEEDDLVADLTCGMGNFFNVMPVEANVYGCELDTKAFKVASYLYPEANLVNKDIRNYIPQVRFDYVVGNPPFNLQWMAENGKEYLSQLYYCLKAAQFLKPLGILALIVPNSFLADSFSDSSMIRKMEAQFRFLGQILLPDDTFAQMGVSLFPIKLQFWQKKGVDSETPARYHTGMDNDLSGGIYAGAAQAIHMSLLQMPKAMLKENRAKILRELAKERQTSASFTYTVEKMLYQIRIHPSLKDRYAQCCAYLHRFYTETQPPEMRYEEWCKRRLTEAKVLHYLRQTLRRQNRQPERDEIHLVKRDYSFAYKGYSAAVRRRMSEELRQPIPVCEAVLRGETLPGYERLLRKKRHEYLIQSQPFQEMTPDTGIGKWLDDFWLWDAENEEEILLNDTQLHDLNLALQKRYTLLQWEQGSGKTLAGIAYGKYRMDRQGYRNTWVISSAISIRNNWNVVLPNYDVSYVFVERLRDLERIKPGDFVLMTFNALCKYRRQIKKWLKIHCCFEPPLFQEEIRELEQRFTELYQSPKKLDEITLDMVIMAPEMVRVISADPKECKACELYLLTTHCTTNLDSSSFTELYADYDAGRFALLQSVREEQQDGCVKDWADRDVLEEEYGIDRYEAWYRDEYFENHFVISLEKLSLMLPPDFIENPKSYN